MRVLNPRIPIKFVAFSQHAVELGHTAARPPIGMENEGLTEVTSDAIHGSVRISQRVICINEERYGSAIDVYAEKEKRSGYGDCGWPSS